MKEAAVKVGKGILEELPVIRKIVEGYDEDTQQKINEQLHSKQIQTISGIIEAINNLNQNQGREVIVNQTFHSDKTYNYRHRDQNSFFMTTDYFEAENYGVEIVNKENKEIYSVFLISLLFNNDERDTTIHTLELKSYNEEASCQTIPDMLKIGSNDWERFNQDEFTLNMPKNSSQRLFFRFISQKYYGAVEVPIKFRLLHTSGSFEELRLSKFILESNVSWMKGSDSSRSTGAAMF